MLLTVSKRLEFSASRRLFDRTLSEAENLAAFGPETTARYGTGRNYVGYFIFSGAINARTGMLMNISEIKARIGSLLREQFDHKFLNEDNPSFADTPPTTVAIAAALLKGAAPLFANEQAQLVACHLSESASRSATAYISGQLETNYWISFSAARQTMSPLLTHAENERLFGMAASPFGHGHNYRARFTIAQAARAKENHLVRYDDVASCLTGIRMELDHKNLNHEVPGLKDFPLTTESLVRYLHQRARACLPIARVRLYEREDFFAEHDSNDRTFLGMAVSFSAAHRLHAPRLSFEENLDLYGKCNNPKGHGHEYLVEATIDGDYDSRTGTLASFDAVRGGIEKALAEWDNKHLDREVAEFRDQPSTGENIITALWPRVNEQLEDRLTRLRLWETPNNRFALRRQ